MPTLEPLVHLKNVKPGESLHRNQYKQDMLQYLLTKDVGTNLVKRGSKPPHERPKIIFYSFVIEGTSINEEVPNFGMP